MNQQQLKEIGTGGVLLLTSAAGQAAAAMPDPETINNVMGLLTQLAVLVVTIWRTIKKPKK